MVPTLRHSSLQASDPMSPQDVAAVLANARALQRAVQAGTNQPLLRGKNIGLLCNSADDEDAVFFRAAALDLGAHVTHIRPSLSEFSTLQEVQHTARVLGRLYDAVECQGIPAALVQRIADAAGVPVYDGIASGHHPTARLAELLGDGDLAGNRRFLLQAVLLGSID